MVDHVAVLVLGDVGRSPRMQYHALSLSEMSDNVRVTLVGYAGEECFDPNPLANVSEVGLCALRSPSLSAHAGASTHHPSCTK